MRLLLALAGGMGVVVLADGADARRRAPASPTQANQPAPAPAAAQPADLVEAAPTQAAVAAEAVRPGAGTAVAEPAPTPAPADASAPRPVAAIAPTNAATVTEGSPFDGPPRGVPVPPHDPTAAKAYAVLSSNCASCHQSGVTLLPAPAANFGNVLDLATVARDPGLVQPGNPDGSKLYQIAYARHVPQAVFGANRGDGPTIGEVEALRDWIEGLPAEANACPDRPRIDAAELDAIMRRWLEVAGPDAARSTRFVSLAHLHNACASDAELAAYRQAVQKLLNSLSWATEPARIETVGDALVILAFRLSDLGWVPAHWERLAKAEPEGGAVPMPEALKSRSASAHPVIRGDWLASVAGRAPLYYDLLGLPDKQADLVRLIGLDLAADARAGSGRLMRAGLKQSAESNGPRLVERHGTREGHPVWLAHDWPSSVSPQDVLDNPLAPQTVGGPKTLAPPERTRMLLTLPNGLIAFGIHDAGGTRRAEAGDVVAGRACMSCHASGPRGFTDEARGALTGDKFAGAREIKDAALFIHPGPAEITKQIEDDGYQYRRALIQAGIDPDLTLDGLEIVTALAQAYDRDVGFDRLVGETGLERGEAMRRLETMSGEARTLAQRVRLAALPRPDAERLLAEIKAAAPAASAEPRSKAPVTATGALGERGDGLGVALWTDRVAYSAGDLVTVWAQATRDCYLTLIDVDTHGKATVLFPNDFEQENLLKAGTPLRVPGEKAPYQLRLKDKGRETTIAVCNTARKVPLGIDLDYERQRFTALGLWRNFLSDAQVLEADYRRNPDRARAAAAARAHALAQALAKGRAAADAAAAAARAIPEPASPGPEAEVRTAIQVRVE